MNIDPAVSQPEARPAEELSNASFLRPSPLVCVVWLANRIALWTVAIVALAIARAFGYLGGEWWETWIFSPSVAWLIPPLHIAIPLLSYRGWGYQLREHDLLVRRGVVTREYVAVPLARVQQVDASSGPLERILGLTTLVVHTAGTRAARTQIPGLPSEHAELLRDELSRKGHELAE